MFGLPFALGVAAASFPITQVHWAYLCTIAVITVVGATLARHPPEDEKRLGQISGVVIIGVGYVLAEKIMLPSFREGWNAATIGGIGQFLSVVLISTIAVIAAPSAIKRSRVRADLSPEAAPGPRPPAPPSSSTGAPQR